MTVLPPSNDPIIFYRGSGDSTEFYLKSMEGGKLAPYTLNDTGVQEVARRSFQATSNATYHIMKPAEKDIGLMPPGRWEKINTVAEQKIFNPDVLKIVQSFKEQKLTDVELEKTNIKIDVNENKVIIRGETYRFSYKSGGKNTSLSQLNADQREKFMLAIAKACEKTTEGIDSNQIKKIVVSFTASKFEKVCAYDKSDKIIAQKVASDNKFDDCRDEISNFVKIANTIPPAKPASTQAIRGVPRGFQAQSCWFGTAMQLLAHSHYLEDENTELLTPEEKKSHEQLLKIKRCILKIDKDPITDKMIKEALESIHTRFSKWDRKWDSNETQDPGEFISSLTTKLFPVELSFSPLPSGKSAQAFLSETDQTTPLPDELTVSIQRARNNNPCSITKNIQIREKPFQLVAAAVFRRGHYIAYSFKDNAWWRCDDAKVTQVTDEAALMEELSAGATQLVYTKIE